MPQQLAIEIHIFKKHLRIYIFENLFSQEKEANNPKGVSPKIPLGCLIEADELILLSKTEFGLNNMIKTIFECTRENVIEVNMD